jgi:Flp pilus assembly protein TadG
MVTIWNRFPVLRRILRDRAGNFGILTALAIPVAAASAGIAVDVSSMASSKSQLQEATDAAALATATALANGTATTSNAQQLAIDFVTGQMSNYLSNDPSAAAALKSGTGVNVTQTSNSSGGVSYSVVVNASYSMQVNGMTHMLGLSTMQISASSTSNSGTAIQNTALSMEIALDKSGSMLENTEVIDTTQSSCIQYYESGPYLEHTSEPQSPCYIKKIAALQTAVGTLLDQLDGADPKAKYVRTAGIAWSSEVDSSSKLDWGTTKTRKNVINGLNADGGTESSAPMQQAYKALIAQKEADAQAKKGNTSFQKIIVLMTDGSNNASSSDTATKKTCDNAKSQNIQIYTVAFMAPKQGQDLLHYCATNDSSYFDVKQMSDLIAAFKTIGAQASKQLTLLTK